MDAATATTPIEGDDFETFLGVSPGPFVDVAEGTEVTLADFFPDRFFEESTEFESLAEFLSATPWEASSFADVPREDLDAFVAEHTEFDSWDGMVRAAGDEFAHRSSAY